MTYYELMMSANRKLDNGDITLGEYEEMIEPLKREIEPERKSGKWIEDKKTPGYIKWNCSECGLLVRNPQKPWYEYCPKCGADMREVNESQ